MKVSPHDIRHQEFSQQALGYQRKQVREYLEQLSKLVAAQRDQIQELQEQLAEQAETIERLKLQQVSLNQDRHLFEDYRLAELSRVEQEMRVLRQQAEQSIQARERSHSQELAARQEQAEQAITVMREEGMRDLRSERETLSKQIDALRQLRNRAVYELARISEHSQTLLDFIEDGSNEGLEPPAALRAYLREDS